MTYLELGLIVALHLITGHHDGLDRCSNMVHNHQGTGLACKYEGDVKHHNREEFGWFWQ